MSITILKQYQRYASINLVKKIQEYPVSTAFKENIHGICMNKSCEADPRIFCFKCLQSIHKNCNMEFYNKEMFIARLTELKLKTQDSRQISDLKQLIGNLINSFKGLHSGLEQLLLDRVNCINTILMNQHTLSMNDWQNGYQLLIQQEQVVPLNTKDIINQLNLILNQVNKITFIQKEEEKIQKIVKSDWSTITQQAPLRIQTPHSVQTIASSPEGKSVATAGGDGDFSIRIWNPLTGYQIGNEMKGHKLSVYSINYSQCGNYIVSGSADKTIRKWEVKTQSQIGNTMLGHVNAIRKVQYSLDQNYIISCSTDRSIRLWDCKTGTECSDKRITHKHQIWCLDLSPKQSELAYGDQDGIITILDYERLGLGKEILQGHTSYVNTIQYSTDGKYIVSGGNDNDIILWDAILRQQIYSCLGHISLVQSVNFSPDMRYIISGGYDDTVRIWSISTGNEITEPLNHHQQCVYSVLYSLDGKYIITGGQDKQLRIMVAPVEMRK